jgi:carbon storage regulator
MLVLSRKLSEQIQIGDDITITVVRVGPVVRIGIDAPDSMKIKRTELIERKSVQSQSEGE